ncbi:3299_t:CDS:2 [Acaulospora colombiana]|uniref:3299_t:CDS:1 n=1 Tax=Acaulospora colombiana TaxID=27376 RepID=A0ACA9LG86_9GLOM|nr:3299_t:CDS:2 [Acaulospora colombiana]
MSTESFIFFSPAQVMPSNPSYFQSDNTACINNYTEPIDFTIYSQDTTSELENDLFPSTHQVQRNPSGYLEESDLSYNYAANQSSFTVTSPHGNSLNDNNPLTDFPTNNTLVPPHLTPPTTSEPLVVEDILNSPYTPYTPYLIFSPVINNVEGQGIIFCPTPDLGTPHTVCTPLTTPYTPYTSNFNSDPSTCFVPHTPSTPSIDNSFDPPLYEEPVSKYYSLFDTKPNISELGTGFRTFNTFNSQMEFASSIDEKKPEEGSAETAVVPGTPNTDASSVSASEKSTSPLSPAVEPSEHQAETNSGSQIGENPDVNIEGARSPSSSPVTTPRLVAIRPRPHEDDDDNSEPSIRRSKRQRTRSISENEEDNEEDGDEKKYTCPECGRGFNRKFNMQTHRSTHDPNRVKPFACEHPNCGSRFTRRMEKARHYVRQDVVM